VTTFAPETEELRQLDDRTRRAWSHYRRRLRDLTGAEYERVEDESWDELQSELDRVDRRRRALQRERS
jgi:hypothetical protein